jgi:hypothetical protein
MTGSRKATTEVVAVVVGGSFSALVSPFQVVFLDLAVTLTIILRAESDFADWSLAG